MKKNCLFMTFVAFAMVANATNTYTKVTTAPTDWSGTYLIVCEGQKVIFNGGASEENLDAKSGPAILQSITIIDGTIMGTDTIDSATFTIAATDDNSWPWSIQSHSGYYIGHKDTADNGLSVESELKNKCKHMLAIDNSGDFIATPRYELGGAYNLQYNKSSDQMRFRYYKPGGKKPVQLYKLVTDPTALTQPTNSSIHRFTKVIKDGRLLIIRDGREFSVLGM